MQFPLTLTFKFWSMASQIRVTDPTGQLVCQVKQRAFRLKEDVTIFEDEQQTRPRYRIRADRVLDIAPQYTISDPSGSVLGAVKREGMKSFWRARYRLLNPQGNDVGLIREENPWIKVADSLLSLIPLVELLTGYFLNPAYLVEIPAGRTALYVRKNPSFLEKRFVLEERRPLPSEQQDLTLAGVMMMVILERHRG